MQGSGSAKAHRPRAPLTCKQAHPPITRAAPRHLTYALVPRRGDAAFLHSLENGSSKSIAAVSIPEVVPASVPKSGLDCRVSSVLVTALVATEIVYMPGANRSSRAFFEPPKARAPVSHQFNLGGYGRRSQIACTSRWLVCMLTIGWNTPEPPL